MRYFSLRKINEKKGWNVLRGQSFQLTGGNRFSHQRITVITSGRNIRRRGFDLRLRLTVEGVGRGAISRISTCRPIKINVKSNCRSILSTGHFCGERAAHGSRATKPREHLREMSLRLKSSEENCKDPDAPSKNTPAE